MSERWRLFGTKKRRRERYEVREKEKAQIEAQRKRVQFGEGGARERADGVFFCRRHKKTSEQSGLCSDVVRLMRFERTTFRVGVIIGTFSIVP